MNQAPGQSFTDTSKPIGEIIANELEARIFSGSLQSGERLVERQLAEDFNVSRQPVRDALKLLEQRGLTSKLPTRGVVVASLSRKDLNDLFVVRESLEALAARLACQNIANGADASRLRDLLHENRQAIATHNDTLAFDTNAAFHEEIIALADNRMLTDILSQILTRMHHLSGDTLDLSTVHAEHEDLFEAITSGNVKLADVSARNHTSCYKDRTRKKLAALS
ncbi:MAG: GntR family transcriptional regulator [Adlercreutzia sp.]|nr:GntR family transcriptional regulator [Adlercreutzia sp.]